MRIYCMSDIHGCLKEFEDALSLVEEHLAEPETMLILMGDYIHGGTDSRGVLDRIMELQKQYGLHKVVALIGNHEEFVMWGDSSINHMIKSLAEDYYTEESDEDKYIQCIKYLPRYYSKGKTIFVHAGIDEGTGVLWECGTGDEVFVSKYPAETGKINNLDMKVVAGHVGTAEIARNPNFHDIYYDGESHYYIDGTVLDSGVIPVLLVDTNEDKYYRVTQSGNRMILPYQEEH